MKLLLISDLHFTDKPLDEFRFDLFEQIRKIIEKESIERVIVAGDILDAKDRHSGKLINRVVDGLVSWFGPLTQQVFCLHGNHDSLESSNPYLYFIRHIQGFEYINEPWTGFQGKCVFLPHSRQPLEDWKNIDLTDKIVFGHVTVNGALAELMIPLESQIEPEFFSKAKMSFFGDVHKAQEISTSGGPIIYIGSPYDTKFNPISYEGSCIILDTDTLKWRRIVLDFPRRVVLDVWSEDDVKREEALLSDRRIDRSQVKVRLHVDRTNIGKERSIHRFVQSIFSQDGRHQLASFELVNDLQEEIQQKTQSRDSWTDFDGYCKRRDIPEQLVSLGRQVLQEVE